MSQPIEQCFPCQRDGQVHLHTWHLDQACLLKRYPGFLGGPGRLEKEARDMAEHQPRWVLTLARGRQRMLCRSCRGTLVFDRGVRCVACGHTLAPSHTPSTCQPAWFGLLPPIGVDSLKKIKKSLLDSPPPGHLVGRQEGLGTFLLVPLLVVYPQGFPSQPPTVLYLPGFFQIGPMPPDSASHAYHMYGNRKMCLFAPGEWKKRTSCRRVIEQRAYAHVIKMLNYANGKRGAFAKVS